MPKDDVEYSNENNIDIQIRRNDIAIKNRDICPKLWCITILRWKNITYYNFNMKYLRVNIKNITL